MHYPYRRIVTGLDANGKSVILFDDDKGFETAGDVTSVALLWQSKEVPVDNSGLADMADEGFSFAFAQGGTKCILVDVQPSDGLMPPGMHATDTLDYLVVIHGRLTLHVEGAEVEAGPGDVVVNRGNLHAWHNKGPEVARMLVINVDAAPVGGGATYFGGNAALESSG